MNPLPPQEIKPVRRQLLRWFDQNRRDLPWRKDRDPYHIWVSEIMLQQTRVAVVRERYPRFHQKFPTLERLAAARLPQVLAEWSGLGYYRRARALHDAARQIAASGNGIPTTAEGLSMLPGIGRYTAAAIASIAFGQRCAVVDGNVERVLLRLYQAGSHQAWRAAEELLSPRRPGDFNQAMMELGATICLPRSPLCSQCPVFACCRTKGAEKSRSATPRRKQEIAYELALRQHSVFLVQRSKQESRMAGMWELPEANGTRSGALLMRLRHAITNTDYEVSVYRGNISFRWPGRWVKLCRLQRLPLTGLTQKILRRAALIQ
jgi:A/G-specific adenine glycosylase